PQPTDRSTLSLHDALPILVPEATVAQRIVRAKRTLSVSGLAYETPRRDQLSERLGSVLEVVYLIFNEGYTAARGEEWLRPQLCRSEEHTSELQSLRHLVCR